MTLKVAQSKFRGDICTRAEVSEKRHVGMSRACRRLPFDQRSVIAG
jgi:hypothetical protein